MSDQGNPEHDPGKTPKRPYERSEEFEKGLAGEFDDNPAVGDKLDPARARRIRNQVFEEVDDTAELHDDELAQLLDSTTEPLDPVRAERMRKRVMDAVDDDELATLLQPIDTPLDPAREERLRRRVMDAIDAEEEAEDTPEENLDDDEDEATKAENEHIRNWVRSNLTITTKDKEDKAEEAGELTPEEDADDVIDELAELDFGPGTTPEDELNNQMLRKYGPNPNPKPVGLKDKVWPPKSPETPQQ